MALELWKPGRMAMMRPFRELARLERELEDAFGPFFRDGREGDPRTWAPAVDVIDHKDEIIVRADLPGMEEKDIDVSIRNGMLTIRGERKEEHEEKAEDYYYCERKAGAFSRTMSLPADVDEAQVKATFKKSVLEVRLPKSTQAKGTPIEVKAA